MPPPTTVQARRSVAGSDRELTMNCLPATTSAANIAVAPTMDADSLSRKGVAKAETPKNMKRAARLQLLTVGENDRTLEMEPACISPYVGSADTT